MQRLLYGSLPTILLTIAATTTPTFFLQAKAETMDSIKTCMQEMMYNKPVTAGGELVRSELSDMAAAIACQNAHKPGFSSTKVKTCVKQVMSLGVGTSGGQISGGGISDTAAATACQNAS
jgi:hypothetical protein